MATFQELLAHNLSGFGITMDASEIPESDIAAHEAVQVMEWVNSLDDRTRHIFWYAGGDIATGMWNNGFFQQWPALYRVAQENPFDGFANTYANIHTCIQHALQEQHNQPAGLAGDGTGVNDVIAAAGAESAPAAGADPYATP